MLNYWMHATYPSNNILVSRRLKFDELIYNTCIDNSKEEEIKRDLVNRKLNLLCTLVTTGRRRNPPGKVLTECKTTS
jgi:hypothetical protein